MCCTELNFNTYVPQPYIVLAFLDDLVPKYKKETIFEWHKRSVWHTDNFNIVVRQDNHKRLLFDIQFHDSELMKSEKFKSVSSILFRLEYNFHKFKDFENLFKDRRMHSVSCTPNICFCNHLYLELST